MLALLGVRYVEKSWWSPASILMLLYTSLVSLSPISPYTNVLGLLLLFSLILTFSFGSSLVSFAYKRGKEERYAFIVSKIFIKKINKIYMLSIVFSIIGLFILIEALNVEFNNFFSLEGIIKISHQSAVARYQENFQTPFLSNILFAFGYFSAFLAGFFKKELKNKSFLVFIVFLLYTFIYSSKAAFLLPAIFFISSYFVRSLLDNGNIEIHIYYILSFFIFLVIVMVIASYFRYSGKISSLEFIKHMLVYFIGNVTPFTDWIGNRYDIQHLYFGQYTFRGTFVLFNLADARAGVYDYFVPILNNESSNIHTAFRGLIEDFSLLGAYFIMFILGVLSKIFYIRISQCKLTYIAFILPIYSYILWSPIYSVLAYNSLLLAHLLLVPFFLYLNSKRRYVCVK